MKRDMNNKERRKVVVRGKKKTYTRTMLVKTAQDIGRRESLHQIKLEQANHQPSTMSRLLAKAKSGIKGVLPNRNVGALHALHPWQEHHLGTRDSADSGYRNRKADPGVPSPGSDHSLTALLAGAARGYSQPQEPAEHLTYEHARERREMAPTPYFVNRAQSGTRVEGDGPSPMPFRTPLHRNLVGNFANEGSYDVLNSQRGVNKAVASLFGKATVVRQNPKKWVR